MGILGRVLTRIDDRLSTVLDRHLEMAIPTRGSVSADEQVRHLMPLGQQVPLFGRPCPSADTDADTSPRRTCLTVRGTWVAALAVILALFLAMWAGSALGFAYTGVPG